MKHKQFQRKKATVYKIQSLLFIAGFAIFTFLFFYEIWLTPYLTKQALDHNKELYYKETIKSAESSNHASTATSAKAAVVIPTVAASATPTTISITPVPVIEDPRDAEGRLLQFQTLLAVNNDVKGWITIPDTNIDYVVLQSDQDNPEFYLSRDLYKKPFKAGSLFLDALCSVEHNSKNLTIHGHNMTSTDNMFHSLVKFKELAYLKARPVINFDTIYQKGQWKIFSVFLTNGSSMKEALFPYNRVDFRDDSEFLNFVYQVRIRSIYQMNSVDIREDDQLLTLSTCSYEVKNYRTVIVARRIREGEDTQVDVSTITKNPEPLFPESYYYRYGGKAPLLEATFKEALAHGKIRWYHQF